MKRSARKAQAATTRMNYLFSLGLTDEEVLENMSTHCVNLRFIRYKRTLRVEIPLRET